MNRVVGVVAALDVEARCLAALVPAGALRVEVSGAGAERAAACTAGLIEGGARALVSWGIAGGLDPALAPGALLVPEHVLTEDGETFATHSTWRAAVLEGLEAAGGAPGVGGELLSAARVLARPADKQAAFHRTGARAVDLESAAVARAAAAAGLPFLALRTVCDPAASAIPRSALLAVDERGRTDALRLALSLLRRPLDVASLLGLQRAFGRARRALVAAAGALEPDLLAPRHP